MTDRLVVALSFASAPSGRFDERLADRLEELVRRGRAFGAELLSWSADCLAFGFQPDDIEEALTFCAAGHMQPLLGEFSGAIVLGAVHLVPLDAGTNGGLGDVLLLARKLAQEAASGEVVVDEKLVSGLRLDHPLGEPMVSRVVPEVRVRAVIKEVPETEQASANLHDYSAWGSLAFVEREGIEQRLVGPPGTLAVLEAAPGMGGSRLLRDHRMASSDRLVLSPQGHGLEPLASLRAAFRARTLSGSTPQLPPQATRTVEGLLEGRGARPSHMARLIEQWMIEAVNATGKPGLIVIDDVSLVDNQSLEVVTEALLDGDVPLRVIVRMPEDTALPAVLAPIAPGPEVSLEALSEDGVHKLALSACGDRWPEAVRKRVVANALTTDWTPLAVLECVAHTLQHVSVDSDGARGSLPSIFPEERVPAHVWVLRRWRLLEPSARAVLSGAAVIGGEVSESLLMSVVPRAASVPMDVATEIERLVRRGWLRRVCPGYVVLNSRTQAQVVLGDLTSPRRITWHRLLAQQMGRDAVSLDLAEAAWHAAAAHDDRLAHSFSVEAAQHAAELGMETGARLLHTFARVHESSGKRVPVTESLDQSGAGGAGSSRSNPPEELLSTTLVSRQTQAPGSTGFPPLEIATSVDMSEDYSKERTGERPILPKPPNVPAGVAPVDDDSSEERFKSSEDISAVRSHPIRPPRPRREMSHPSNPSPKETVEEKLQVVPQIVGGSSSEEPESSEELGDVIDAAEPTDTKVDQDLERELYQAVVSGDHDQLRYWLERLEARDAGSPLAARLRALLDLETPESRSEALQALRDQVHRQDISELDSLRNRLAYAIGLLQHGQEEHALNEGLHALAIARKLQLSEAEQACMRFLRILYERTGHEQWADRWTRR